MASYNLIDYANILPDTRIEWLGASPLEEGVSYVFSFDLNTCWYIGYIPQESGLPEYDVGDVTEYVDCEECNKVCYRLIDCDLVSPDVTTDDILFQDYVGEIIKWKDDLDAEHCATVVTYLCREEAPANPEITILSCFRDCTRCEESLVPPEEVLPTEFTVKRRPVKPNYMLAICSMAYYNNVKEKFSEGSFHQMVSKRYGIEFCCEIDLLKYSLKNELTELQILEAANADPGADTSLITCTDGVGIGNMQINNDSCNVFRVYPETE